MLIQEKRRRSTSPAFRGRGLTGISSGLWLPRGRIIPGRSLPNPRFKTSKDGGGLHKPPGHLFFAVSCFFYLGKFFLLFNLNVSCSCLLPGVFVLFTWIFLPLLQHFSNTDVCCAPPQPSLISCDLSLSQPALSLAAMPSSWCTPNKIPLDVLILRKGPGIQLKGSWAFPPEVQQQSRAHLPGSLLGSLAHPLGLLHTSIHTPTHKLRAAGFAQGKY